MPLNDSQIERYSRQIIVPRIGGVAQEKLLAARIALAGEPGDIAEPLAYLVGAGIGRIHLVTPDADPERLCREMRALNPDSTVIPSLSSSDRIDLAIALIGSGRILEEVRSDDAFNGACIVARLDAPPKIAVLPEPPPCIRCADADILAAFGSRSEMSAFVAMIATAEALKIAARYEPGSGNILIEFHGYSTSSRPLSPAASGCACGARVKA